MAVFLFLVWNQKQVNNHETVSKFERPKGFAIEKTGLLVHYDVVATFPRNNSTTGVRIRGHLNSHVDRNTSDFCENSVDAPIDKKTIDI